VRNFTSGGEMTCFHCNDSCLVSGSQWRIHVSSGAVIIRDNTLSMVALQISNSSEHVSIRSDFRTGVRKHGAHLARTLLKPKCSCNIFKMLLYETPTFVAITRIFSRRSPIIRFLTAWQHSSVVSSTGRLARVSSSSDVRPRLNSATT